MTGHRCDVPHCDGTDLGHTLAVDFPEETRQVDEAFDTLRRPEETWAPDGQGHHPGVRPLVAAVGAVVHLRLSSSLGRYPRAACGRDALGQWWTGDPSEVTCPRCREAHP